MRVALFATSAVLHFSRLAAASRTPGFVGAQHRWFRNYHRAASPLNMLARGRKGEGTKEQNKASKICVVCGRPFTWRKKWERCWDEVTTCSKRCNSERRKSNRSAKSGAGEEEFTDSEGENAALQVITPHDDLETVRKQAKKAAKKATKAAKRAKREGKAPQGTGQKACQQPGCGRRVDLLVRCQTDDSAGQWLLVCGKCWRDVSGGVVDGDANHPGYRVSGEDTELAMQPSLLLCINFVLYVDQSFALLQYSTQYGGLWKNRHVAVDKAQPRTAALDEDGLPEVEALSLSDSSMQDDLSVLLLAAAGEGA